jgi:ankyrin repeat protein
MYGNTALHVAGTKGAIYLRENIELPALFDSKISSVMTSISVIMCDTSEISQKCGNFFNNQRNILNLLLEAGCDVNILNNNSKKALDLTKEYGFHDIVLL